MKHTRFRLGIIGVAVVVSMVLVAASAGASERGSRGNMPTAEDCASGQHDGVWLGHHVGSAAVCVSAGGHTILYVGGSAPNQCGTVVVGDQNLAADDPNECDLGPRAGRTLRFRVQRPSDYETSERRYPVLYLLPGGGTEDDWFEHDPTLASLADQGVIIVSVFSRSGRYNDWRSGDLIFETLYTEILPALIDAEYRTIPDRAYRAVAGGSEGGYGAMLYAARHPDLYVAAASFSGSVDITDPGFMGVETVAEASFVEYQDPAGSAYPVWGDPVQNEVVWRGRNPTELAANLGGVSVWTAAGDGNPTADEIAADPGILVFGSAIEVLVRRMNDTFDAALTREGIEHTYVRREGIHGWPTQVADLHQWFPIMMDAFGTPPPSSFDYRSIDPEFSVWGWRFRTDPRRASEFLEIDDASSSGLTVTGSGITTVTTAPYFTPGQTVLLKGATAPSSEADSEGRITFDIELGEAHAFQQYTAPQRAAEAAAGDGYFTTMTVSFSACPGRSPAHACERHAGGAH